MTDTSDAAIRVEGRRGVATVTLNRPDRQQCLRRCADRPADPGVRGSRRPIPRSAPSCWRPKGRSFSAGAPISAGCSGMAGLFRGPRTWQTPGRPRAPDARPERPAEADRGAGPRARRSAAASGLVAALRHRHRGGAGGSSPCRRWRLGLVPAVISPFVGPGDRRPGGAALLPDGGGGGAVRRRHRARPRPGAPGGGLPRISRPRGRQVLARLAEGGPDGPGRRQAG